MRIFVSTVPSRQAVISLFCENFRKEKYTIRAWKILFDPLALKIQLFSYRCYLEFEPHAAAFFGHRHPKCEA